jgi:hypothetical protein
MIRRLLLATSLLPWGAVWAQDTTAVPASTAQEPEWSIPRRRLDLYAGLRSNGGTNVMVGAKFSRRLPSTRNMAAAGFFEVAFSSPETEYILGALFQYMPLNRLLLETGPGAEFDGGSNFFWRVSGEYELRARKLFIIPKFYLDFIEGETVVGYGVAIGRH